MTQTLPMATYLHRINQKKHSPCCTHCSQDGSQNKSLALLQNLSEFHYARTAEHNQVCKVLAAFPAKTFSYSLDSLSLSHETPLGRTALLLELVPTAVVLNSGRHISDSDAAAAK